MSDAAVLVDANVLVDIFRRDETWYSWSAGAFEAAVDTAEIAINPIVYAELSIPFQTIEELEEALAPRALLRLPLPWQAAYLAGKAFLAYRRDGGERRLPLPDFYIGAHAAVAGMRLLTRDASRYRTYFPRLELIAP